MLSRLLGFVGRWMFIFAMFGVLVSLDVTMVESEISELRTYALALGLPGIALMVIGWLKGRGKRTMWHILSSGYQWTMAFGLISLGLGIFKLDAADAGPNDAYVRLGLGAILIAISFAFFLARRKVKEPED